jgi:hypothetical protein
MTDKYVKPTSLYLVENGPVIKHGGGGGISVDTETKNYVDAKMEAVRAQNDARFAEVLTKLDGVEVPSIWQIVSALAVAIGIVFGVLAYASDRFDGGLSASSIVQQQYKNEEAILDQEAKLDRILGILDSISLEK